VLALDRDGADEKRAQRLVADAVLLESREDAKARRCRVRREAAFHPEVLPFRNARLKKGLPAQIFFFATSRLRVFA